MRLSHILAAVVVVSLLAAALVHGLVSEARSVMNHRAYDEQAVPTRPYRVSVVPEQLTCENRNSQGWEVLNRGREAFVKKPDGSEIKLPMHEDFPLAVAWCIDQSGYTVGGTIKRSEYAEKGIAVLWEYDDSQGNYQLTVMDDIYHPTNLSMHSVRRVSGDVVEGEGWWNDRFMADPNSRHYKYYKVRVAGLGSSE